MILTDEQKVLAKFINPLDFFDPHSSYDVGQNYCGAKIREFAVWNRQFSRENYLQSPHLEFLSAVDEFSYFSLVYRPEIQVNLARCLIGYCRLHLNLDAMVLFTKHYCTRERIDGINEALNAVDFDNVIRWLAYHGIEDT